MHQSFDPAATASGFGFAAYLVMVTLLDKMADGGLVTRDQIKDILDHALLNAETHQAIAPSPQMHVVARKVIEETLRVSEMKRDQSHKPRSTARNS